MQFQGTSGYHPGYTPGYTTLVYASLSHPVYASLPYPGRCTTGVYFRCVPRVYHGCTTGVPQVLLTFYTFSPEVGEQREVFLEKHLSFPSE